MTKPYGGALPNGFTVGMRVKQTKDYGKMYPKSADRKGVVIGGTWTSNIVRVHWDGYQQSTRENIKVIERDDLHPLAAQQRSVSAAV